jgi:hypothetical protein
MDPDFVSASAATSDLHDLALLILDQGYAGVKPAQLQTTPVVEEGQPLTIVGYGRTAADGQSGLKTSATAIVAAVAPGQFEVRGDGAPQPCYGDSGGPAFTAPPEAPASAASQETTVIGVVSRGASATERCDAGAIYGRVDLRAGWIERACSGAGCSIADRDGPPPRAGWAALASALAALLCVRTRDHRKRTPSEQLQKGSS